MTFADWFISLIASSCEETLTCTERQAVVSRLEKKSLDRGAPLFTQGTIPPGVWIIRSGLVAVYMGAGKRRSVVRLIRSEGSVGDVYVLLSKPANGGARTLLQTESLFMKARSFRWLLCHIPSMASFWTLKLAQQVEEDRFRVHQVTGGAIRKKVAAILDEECSTGDVKLPQKVIAEMLGVNRGSVNRTLRDLETEGVVSLGYGTISVEDRYRLKRVARED